MTPEMWNAVFVLGGALIPALLARLGLKVPLIMPAPSVPQVPTVDKPLSDMLGWLADYKAGRISLDAADAAAFEEIKAALAGK